MRKIILILLILGSCTSVRRPLTISTGHSVQKRTFYKVEGAGDVLRNTPHATIAVWIKPEAVAASNEDIFNVSVGGKAEDWKTRAGFRVLKDGIFESVARADDHEEISEIRTSKGLEKPGEWQHVALTIDYANKKMEFFIDGHRTETVHSLYRFTRPQTSDTPSHNVTLGSEDDGKSAYFNGDLAAAFVDKRILSESEIQALMKKTKP